MRNRVWESVTWYGESVSVVMAEELVRCRHGFMFRFATEAEGSRLLIATKRGAAHLGRCMEFGIFGWRTDRRALGVRDG